MKKVLGYMLCGMMLILPGLLFAAPLDPQNPYLDEDDGNTVDINTTGTGADQNDALVNVIKGAVNWILGILALIALIILMYGGFQMVTSAGEEDKYTAGFTILKHAATGLILIGVAWFVISIIFWLVNVIAGPTTNPGAANTNI